MPKIFATAATNPPNIIQPSIPPPDELDFGDGLAVGVTSVEAAFTSGLCDGVDVGIVIGVLVAVGFCVGFMVGVFVGVVAKLEYVYADVSQTQEFPSHTYPDLHSHLSPVKVAFELYPNCSWQASLSEMHLVPDKLNLYQ